MLTKYLIPLLALCGFLFALNYVLHGEPPPPIAKPVAEPAGAPFQAYVAGAGIIEASTQNIAIGTPLPGIVTKVFIHVDSHVKKGDPLFQLDDRDAQADLLVKKSALQTAEARIAEAEATLADLQNQLKLMESVTDKRAISVDELDRRRYAVRTAKTKLETSKRETAAAAVMIKVVETTLDRLLVRAPVEGNILQVNIRAGEFAQTGLLNRPLLVLGNVDKVHVRVDIDENDAWRFQKDAEAVAFLRGNREVKTALQFVRVEPYVIPKQSLTGDSTERVDTRVLQVLYSFDKSTLPLYVGQQMDVFIESKSALPTVKPQTNG